ncbi:MAG: helix-turn-helix transcriptional regulator [Bacteroidota bacterium]|nr:helix-turn-helix transcriptional regulator [Bacteroidota bacterium]
MDEKLFLKKLGQNIRRIRKERKLTQVELGYRCDFERPSMNRIEAGNTNPTALTLKKLAEALEVSIEEFFKFETKEKSKK